MKNTAAFFRMSVKSDLQFPNFALAKKIGKGQYSSE
jgi:hypothetical protein